MSDKAEVVFENSEKRFPRTNTELSRESSEMLKLVRALESRVMMLEQQAHFGDPEGEPLEMVYQEYYADLRARRRDEI